MTRLALLTRADRDRVAARVSASLGRFGGTLAPAKAPPYAPPAPCEPTVIDAVLAKRNRDGLQNFVLGHLRIACGKPATEAEAHLTRWADYLNRQMPRLGCSTTPRELVGLTAGDIAWARETLMSAIRKREAA